jgi:hypothetical protein
MKVNFTVVTTDFCAAVRDDLLRLLFSPSDERCPAKFFFDLGGAVVSPAEVLRAMTGKAQPNGSLTIVIDGAGLYEVCLNLAQSLHQRNEVWDGFESLLRAKYGVHLWEKYCTLIAEEAKSAAGETIEEALRAAALIDVILLVVRKLVGSEVFKKAGGDHSGALQSLLVPESDNDEITTYLSCLCEMLDAYRGIEAGPTFAEVCRYLAQLD